MLHPTRQREGFAGRTSPGAAFTAAGTLVLHGPRSSAVAVVWELLVGVRRVCNSNVLVVVVALIFFAPSLLVLCALLFVFFGSLVSSFRAEDKPEKSDCRGGTPVILQEM